MFEDIIMLPEWGSEHGQLAKETVYYVDSYALEAWENIAPITTTDLNNRNMQSACYLLFKTDLSCHCFQI